MMPNTITSSGAHADIWSDLKSMDYALQRAMDTEVMTLTELDKERLTALADLLSSFVLRRKEEPAAVETLSFDANEHSYSLDFDVENELRELPAFKAWHENAKQGVAEKANRLYRALNELVSSELIANRQSTEELNILRQFLRALIARTEPSLSR